jgi:predicted  nucleic acid-binding Zn-ribbon protein
MAKKVISGGQDERIKVESLIESLRAKLPVGVLALHDKMRAKGKRSVAGVRRGVCSGCHLALGVGNVAAVRAKELRRCGNCGRYVYMVEDEESALPTRAKRKPAARTVPASG